MVCFFDKDEFFGNTLVLIGFWICWLSSAKSVFLFNYFWLHSFCFFLSLSDIFYLFFACLAWASTVYILLESFPQEFFCTIGLRVVFFLHSWQQFNWTSWSDHPQNSNWSPRHRVGPFSCLILTGSWLLSPHMGSFFLVVAAMCLLTGGDSALMANPLSYQPLSLPFLRSDKWPPVGLTFRVRVNVSVRVRLDWWITPMFLFVWPKITLTFTTAKLTLQGRNPFDFSRLYFKVFFYPKKDRPK